MRKGRGFLLATCLAFACCGRSPLSGEAVDALPDGRLVSEARPFGDQTVTCLFVPTCGATDTSLDCVRTAECTFQWAEPVAGWRGRLSLKDAGSAPVSVPEDDWALSKDGRTLSLSGASCELARQAPTLRLVVWEQIHGCIL